MSLRLFTLVLLLPHLVNGQPLAPRGTTFVIEPNSSGTKVWKQLEERYPKVVSDLARLQDARLELRAGPVLFWDLLDEMALKSKSRLRVLPSEGRIQLVPGGPSRSPTTVAGPFRLVLRRVSSDLDLESRTVSSFGTMEVAWEPQLQPFFVETRPQRLQIQTGLGKKIPGLAEGSATVPVDGRIGFSFDFHLPPVDRAEAMLTSLEGTLSAVVPTRMVPISMPSLAELEAAVNADAPELAFPRTGPAGRVSRIVRTRDRWSIQVVVQGPPGAGLFESYQSWVIQNEPTLRTNEGKVWKSSGYFLEANTPNRSVVTYHFSVRECPDRPEPALWHFQYTTPAAIVNMEIPFRFTEIPLP